MKQFNYVMTHESAPHPKLVSVLQKEAARFESCIDIISGNKQVSLKEGNAWRSLGLGGGSRVMVRVDGKDEEAAVAAMQNYFVENL